jgi:hypothetical protein
MRRAPAALVLLVALGAPAGAIVGDAGPADEALARHVVMIVGARRSACTGTAIARDLVLTAAHCLAPGTRYSVLERDPGRRPKQTRVENFQRHPDFDLETALARRETADVALLKLAEPLGANFLPAAIGTRDFFLLGDRLLIAGFGITGFRNDRDFGTLRSALLMVVRHPSSGQLRLADPSRRGDTAGLGACSGDSGGPVFEDSGGRLALVAVVSWATDARGGPGCGGLTGVTPVARFRAWIDGTAKTLGSAVAP